MSAMEWASQYDANAAPYVSPDMVKTYYENNARYPSWSSPQVEQWFVQKGEPLESQSLGFAKVLTANTRSSGHQTRLDDLAWWTPR